MRPTNPSFALLNSCKGGVGKKLPTIACKLSLACYFFMVGTMSLANSTIKIHPIDPPLKTTTTKTETTPRVSEQTIRLRQLDTENFEAINNPQPTKVQQRSDNAQAGFIEALQNLSNDTVVLQASTQNYKNPVRLVDNYNDLYLLMRDQTQPNSLNPNYQQAIAYLIDNDYDNAKLNLNKNKETNARELWLGEVFYQEDKKELALQKWTHNLNPKQNELYYFQLLRIAMTLSEIHQHESACKCVKIINNHDFYGKLLGDYLTLTWNASNCNKLK